MTPCRDDAPPADCRTEPLQLLAGATPSGRLPDEAPPADCRTEPPPLDHARARHTRRLTHALEHALGRLLDAALDQAPAALVEEVYRALVLARQLDAALTALVDPDPRGEGGSKVSTTEADDRALPAHADFSSDATSSSHQGAPEGSRAAATDTLSPAAAAIDGAPEAGSGAPEAGSGRPRETKKRSRPRVINERKGMTDEKLVAAVLRDALRIEFEKEIRRIWRAEHPDDFEEREAAAMISAARRLLPSLSDAERLEALRLAGIVTSRAVLVPALDDPPRRPPLQ